MKRETDHVKILFLACYFGEIRIFQLTACDLSKYTKCTTTSYTSSFYNTPQNKNKTNKFKLANTYGRKLTWKWIRQKQETHFQYQMRGLGGGLSRLRVIGGWARETVRRLTEGLQDSG